MKTRLFISIALAIMLAMGCGSGGNPNRKSGDSGSSENKDNPSGTVADESLSEPMTDSVSVFSSAAARIGKADSNRRFIRTADLKFRVSSVLESTLIIEDIVLENDGFVILSNLQSEKQSTKTVKVTADSAMEVVSFRTENHMSLRVPVERLDAVLRSIGENSEYMDYRIIKADDVALRMLSNELAVNRENDYQDQLGNNKSGGNYTTDQSLDSRRREDEARLKNMELNDQVKYSTISLTIYQDITENRHLVPVSEKITEYERSFGEKMGEALHDGWRILEFLVLLVTRLWVFLLAALITIILIWMTVRKPKR